MAKDKEASRAKVSKRSILKLKKKKLKREERSSEASEVNDSLSGSEPSPKVLNDKNVGGEEKVSEKAVKSKRKKQKLQYKGSLELSRSELSPEVLNDKSVGREEKVSEKAVKSRRKKQKLQHNGSLEKAHTEKSSTETPPQNEIAASHGNEEEDNGKRIKIKKVKKTRKSTKNDVHLYQKKSGLDKLPSKVDEEEVYNISSVDEDSSRGMQKWLLNYKESRPGLEILQEQIDEFIVAYEEKQEQERKEREERAAEGGWTVVVHHKGRKKTTDTESGITVGSVAQAAVLDNMSKKKSKEVPLNFYRFQKREAQRNELMMLQQRFEQDKKRIQQLRAERKFRPY